MLAGAGSLADCFVVSAAVKVVDDSPTTPHWPVSLTLRATSWGHTVVAHRRPGRGPWRDFTSALAGQRDFQGAATQSSSWTITTANVTAWKSGQLCTTTVTCAGGDGSLLDHFVGSSGAAGQRDDSSTTVHWPVSLTLKATPCGQRFGTTTAVAFSHGGADWAKARG